MTIRPRARHVGFGVAAAFLLACAPARLAAQAPPLAVRDSVEVAASARYEAGGLHRFLLGSGYRDLWATRMQVEILDLESYAGGLRATKVGGGVQTRSLRFVTPSGVQYVFRSVDKDGTMTPPAFRGTVVETIFRDQIGASDPAAALVAAQLLEAAGVLHATPVLIVMPDDPALGEYREAFAGRLGMLEEYPGMADHHAGFAGAVAIIDSDTLLTLLDSDPEERIDAPALLAARLMDMLLGDWDRHQGQWKWARMDASPRSPWRPIPRDRDKAFISYGGVLPGLARLAAPNLTPFKGSFASVQALTWNSLEFDRRLLSGLARPVWDSVTAELASRITDSVIDLAVLALPPEHLASAPALAAKLKQRRDALPGAADRFYRVLASVADIHATDAPDRATVTRVDERFVDVQLASGQGTPYFTRRFDRLETSEIRVFLHGGGDTAVITGSVPRSIVVRVIGGNGANVLLDSSLVGASSDRARLYDDGSVTGVGYGPDTLFSRKPWVTVAGRQVVPARDHGAKVGPIAGLRINRDLGIVPHLGVAKVHYGYGRSPYASMVRLDGEYAIKVDGFRVGVTADRRFEGTRAHATLVAQLSELEVLSWHGLGNDTPDSTSSWFDVQQQQWYLRPSVGWALGPRSDLSLGPVVQYSVTDNAPNLYLAATRPYGAGRFGEAGLLLSLRHDALDRPHDPHHGVLADVSAAVYPAVWDVTSTFASVTGNATQYFAVPLPLHPVLVIAGGAKKVFGAYPFHDAAFLGGRNSIRSLDAQRYAGDAAVYSSVELKVPVARFALILPWSVGVFGVVSGGRVWTDGMSSGGWHGARGLGFWVGFVDPGSAVRFCRQPGRHSPC